MALTLGYNRTVYSSEDIQALLRALEDVLEAAHAAGKVDRKHSWYFPNYDEINLTYGSASMTEFAKATSNAGDSVKILSPSRVEKRLSPTEALSMADLWVLPEEAVVELAAAFAEKAGYAPLPRAYRGRVRVNRLSGLLRGKIKFDEVVIRRTRRIADPAPKLSKAERIERLRHAFESGGAHSKMTGEKWAVRNALKEYHGYWLYTEGQRERLVAAGGEAEPHPDVEELALEMLRRAQDIKAGRE